MPHQAFFCCILLLLASAAPAQQTFTNITTSAGISGQTGLGHAVGWCDFNGDGYEDVAFSNQMGPGFWLYRNNGDETFSNVTSTMGLSNLSARKILWGELSGDTKPDFILSNNGSHFYRNTGLTFANSTSGSGLSGTPKELIDIDRDGNLDVVTASGSQLRWHRNLGTGTFDTPQIIGTASDTWTTTAFDYDLDGDVDIYVGTYGSSLNQLFQNNNDGTFTEVAASAQVAFNNASHGLAVGDYDNDGWPDLYIGGYSSQRCRLYRNLGDGTFEDTTTASGAIGHDDTRTSSFVDYDNDGYLDIFSSHHDFYSYSNTMLHNNGDGTFSETAVSLGLSGEWIGDYFGVGWSDFNNDGAMDLFAAGHIDKYRLFRNDDNPGNFFILHLHGTDSTFLASGTTVELHAGGTHLTRQVQANSGRNDGHSPVLHFGLGAATEVDSLIIHWPSGLVQKTGTQLINQTITIEEEDALSWVLPSNKGWTMNGSPNPFNPQTLIKCEFPTDSKIGTIDIFNTRGHLVRRLNPTIQSSGMAEVFWNGRDAQGRAMPSGTYFAIVKTDTGSASTKLMLVE